jgi:hypothetical protein
LELEYTNPALITKEQHMKYSWQQHYFPEAPVRYKSIFLCAVLLSSCKAPVKSEPQRIEKQLTRAVDVTGDGITDAITLHIQGESLSSPFFWTLAIRSEGKEVFRYDGDGTWFNAFFGQAGYVSDCTGYDACKEKFFYRDILDNLILPPSSYNVDAFLDKGEINSLYGLGRPYLKQCCGVDGKEADIILSGMAERLKNGTAIVIQNFTSAATLDPHAAMFAPEVGRFVPIYEP